jgi:hypothetical protein
LQLDPNAPAVLSFADQGDDITQLDMPAGIFA